MCVHIYVLHICVYVYNIHVLMLGQNWAQDTEDFFKYGHEQITLLEIDPSNYTCMSVRKH